MMIVAQALLRSGGVRRFYKAKCLSDNKGRFLSTLSPGSDSSSLLMGCVSYDPSVGEIWGGMKDYLVNEAQVPFDYVLFTNYETQVRSLVKGHIDFAWNGPLAHVLLEQQSPNVVSLGMRDCDRDFESLLVVRNDSGISNISQLSGRVLLTGSSDSPQANVVPLYHLESVLGIQFRAVVPHDYDLGKHGDTALGEIYAMEALVAGKGDAAVVSKMIWGRALAGMLPSVDPKELSSTCQQLHDVELPTFDHCQFDALGSNPKKAQLNDFGNALFAMNWDNPEHQKVMKAEGIKRKWAPPRQSGYDIVRKAVASRGIGGGSSSMRGHPASTDFQYSSQQTRSYSSTANAKNQPPENIAVIGAGVAGIQTLRALKGAGIGNVTAFEASDKVGGLWKSNYSNFGAQVPRQLYEFPDYPMDDVKWGDFATGPQIQKYTESFINDFGLRESIRFQTKVLSAKQDDDSKKWTVVTETDGKKIEESYDYIINATGLFSNLNKYLPPVLEHQPNVIHSSDFCDTSVAQGKRVVVVGGGKSAVDCSIEASKAGASSVTMLQRETHWPTPRLIAGLIPFQYIFLSRLGQALVSAHTAPYPVGTGDTINAFYKSKIGPMLMKPVFRSVEELFAFQFGLQGELRPKRGVVHDFYNVALVLSPEFGAMRNNGQIKIQLGEIDQVNGSSIKLKDGSSNVEDADIIISATGFKQDYSFYDEKMQSDIGVENSDGLYLYRGILPEKVSNLAFIGHLAVASNITSYGLQAEWLARLLTGRVAMPTPDAMKEEIEDHKEWARSWMPPSKIRGMNVMLHQTHYNDQLVRDMGENPHRKMPNVLSEMFMPYEPSDYDGIIGGEVTNANVKASNNAVGV